MSIKVSPLDHSQPRTISIGEDRKPSQNASKIDSTAPTSASSQDPATLGTPEAKQASISQPDERMMDLMRKEMLLRDEARRIKAEKEAFEASRKQQPSGMTAEEWKRAFMEDPSKVGLDLQQIADRYLNQPSEQDTRTRALEDKIAQLEETISQNNQRLETAQKQAYENAKKQFKADAQRMVANNPEKYEAIAADSAYDAVVSLIETTYQEENVLLSVDEAMQKVEDYLTDRALKYAGLKKVRAKADQSSQGSSPSTEQKTPTTPKTQERTSQSLSRSMVQSSRTLTPAERRERAIRIAMGQKVD